MKLFLTSVLLALVFQAAPLCAQEPSAVRMVPIPDRENGYSNFQSITFNTKAEFDSFLAGTANQTGWNNRQAFVEALQKNQRRFRARSSADLATLGNLGLRARHLCAANAN